MASSQKMSRSVRLSRLLQILHARPMTSVEDLAARLGVSDRTVYRDLSSLKTDGLDVARRSRTGYGVGDEEGLLYLGQEEIEAMAVGAQIVEAWGEPALASVAVRMLDKVASALPGVAQRALDRTPLGASRAQSKYCWVAGLGKLRQALAERRKLYFAYRAAGEDVRTERVVQPRSLVFRGDHWSLLAWCEVREEYRSFRPERMRDVCVLDERYAPFETSTKEGEL